MKVDLSAVVALEIASFKGASKMQIKNNDKTVTKLLLVAERNASSNVVNKVENRKIILQEKLASESADNLVGADNEIVHVGWRLRYKKRPTLSSLINMTNVNRCHIFVRPIQQKNLQKRYIINPPNEFCVTALVDRNVIHAVQR